jgi:hypothetical protein
VGSVSAFLSTVAGVLVGGLITWLVSRHYYQRASKDLRREAESLRREANRLRGYLLVSLRVLQALSGGHGFTIRYDEQGEPVGVDYRSTVTDQLPLQDHAEEPKLKPPDDESR